MKNINKLFSSIILSTIVVSAVHAKESDEESLAERNFLNNLFYPQYHCPLYPNCGVGQYIPNIEKNSEDKTSSSRKNTTKEVEQQE